MSRIGATEPSHFEEHFAQSTDYSGGKLASACAAFDPQLHTQHPRDNISCRVGRIDYLLKLQCMTRAGPVMAAAAP